MQTDDASSRHRVPDALTESALVTVEELRELGEMSFDHTDDGRDAMTAFMRRIRARQTAEDDLAEEGGLVIASRLRSGHEHAGALIAGERASNNPVTVASACLAYLHVLEKAECLLSESSGTNGEPVASRAHADRQLAASGFALSRDAVLQQLSRILVSHPVLMDFRVLWHTMRSPSDLASMPCLLAELSFGTLPAPEHGFTVKELRDFATHPSVLRGLTYAPRPSASPNATKWPAPRFVAMKQFDATIKGATRGGFISSYLYLSALAAQARTMPYVTFGGHGERDGDADLSNCLAAAFWDVFVVKSHRTYLSSAAFQRAVTTPSIAHMVHDQVRVSSAFALGDRAAFRPRLNISLKADAPLFGDPASGAMLDYDQAHTRAREAIGALVSCGLHPDEASAAQWLAATVSGSQRNSAQVAPSATLPAALAFLDVLHSCGVDTSLAGATVANFTFLGDDPEAASAVLIDARKRGRHMDNCAVWRDALAAHRTRNAMNQVLHAVTDSPRPDGAPAVRRSSV